MLFFIAAFLLAAGMLVAYFRPAGPMILMDEFHSFKYVAFSKYESDALKIFKDGDLVYLSYLRHYDETIGHVDREMSYYVAHYRVNDEDIAGLVEMLNSSGFRRNKNLYSTIFEIQGGIIFDYVLHAGDYEKRVFCNNTLPARLERLTDFIRKIFVASHLNSQESTVIKVNKEEYREVYDLFDKGYGKNMLLDRIDELQCRAMEDGAREIPLIMAVSGLFKKYSFRWLGL